MSLNTLTISGNLGADAELKYTANGAPVITISVAVNERVPKNDGSGEYTDRANWIDAVMFGRRAEAIAPYLRKGDKVSLIGHLHTHSWEKDGQRYKRMEVRIDEIELMSARRERQQPAAQVPTQEPPAPPQDYAPADVYDNDIPF